MTIIPSIDIRNGTCVRLFQGKFDKETVYSNDPVAFAKQWESEGATFLHVIDLDGAATGIAKNISVIKKIIQSVKIPVEIGGGLRDKQTVLELISAGAARVVLGTAAFEQKALFDELLSQFSSQIVVALETKNGKLVTNGWQTEIAGNYIHAALQFEKRGVKRFLYSDVIKDGTLTEPNYNEITALTKTLSVPLIVAGGISSVDAVKKLQVLGVEGVIIGKALYEKTITLSEVLAIC